MNALTILSELLGGIAIAISVVIYSRKQRSKLLIFKGIQDTLFVCHYALRGSYTAAVTSAICIVRSVIYAQRDRKKWASSVLWLILFLVLFGCSAALTWKNIYSLFPAVSSSLSSFAFRCRDPRNAKKIQIVASCCTLVYNIFINQSITVYLAAGVTILTSLYSIFTTKPLKEIMAPVQEASDKKVTTPESTRGRN